MTLKVIEITLHIHTNIDTSKRHRNHPHIFVQISTLLNVIEITPHIHTNMDASKGHRNQLTYSYKYQRL